MKVRTWEVDGDTLQVISNNPEEMPTEMVDRLFPNFVSLHEDRQAVCSVEVRGTERGGYMFDPANMKNGVVMYQLSMEEEEEAGADAGFLPGGGRSRIQLAYWIQTH